MSKKDKKNKIQDQFIQELSDTLPVDELIKIAAKIDIDRNKAVKYSQIIRKDGLQNFFIFYYKKNKKIGKIDNMILHNNLYKIFYYSSKFENKESCTYNVDSLIKKIVQKNEEKKEYNTKKFKWKKHRKNRWKYSKNITTKFYNEINTKFKFDDFELYEKFTMELTDKLAIGLGEPDSHEVSIIRDHLTKVPYIPASSLKGLFRRMFRENQYGFNENLENELKILRNKLNGIDLRINSFKDIEMFILGKFNNESDVNHSSKVIIFDAYPKDTIKNDIDIMSVHNEGKAKNPIKFPVISQERFTFKFIIRDTDLYDISNNLINIFKIALKDFGVGAKTQQGYGFFKEVD